MFMENVEEALLPGTVRPPQHVQSFSDQARTGREHYPLVGACFVTSEKRLDTFPE
jgi:hypothetical protein